MTLKVVPVETNHVLKAWPKVEGFVKSALDKATTEDTRNYNEHHIQQYLTSGQWMLVVAVDEQNEIQGACTISFINYPLHRVAFVTCIGGKLISSPETFEQFKALCSYYGATKIQGYGRPAIVRLWHHLGFESGATLVEYKL